MNFEKLSVFLSSQRDVMKEFSDNPIVYQLMQSCVLQGISHIVMSPGSRNAPLILSFARQENVKCYSIVDERVAGFFALGLAHQTGGAVALICTSGTAVLNYAPAVAEAYYQNIPLFVISADRPKELTGQAEGQAINQTNVLQNIVENSYQLPSENQKHHIDYARRICSEAISLCVERSRPVHINIPLWEPLYNFATYDHRTYKGIMVSKGVAQLDKFTTERLVEKFSNARKVLVVVGFMTENDQLNAILERLVEEKNVVVLTEAIANLKSDCFHYNIDRLLSASDSLEELSPDLAITCGGTLVSKMIKQWLRKGCICEHWHINDREEIVDTFQKLTEDIRLCPEDFFEQILPKLSKRDNEYKIAWRQVEEKSIQRHNDYVERIGWSDLKAFEGLLARLPKGSALHLGNSTVVRYHQLFPYDNTLQYASNRGVSGIEGCTSTAVGSALAFDGFTTLVIGDISLRYDSNALWHKYVSEKFRIIVINNGGGGIFRFLKDASQQDELEQFFETTHSSKANKSLANYWGIDYISVCSEEELKVAMDTFYQESNVPKMLEIFTPRLENANVLRDYFTYMKEM